MAEQVQRTLYQVSTATALVEGIYQGAVQVAALPEHGLVTAVAMRITAYLDEPSK